MSYLNHLGDKITLCPIDRNFLPQEKLDIVAKEKTSLYRWRGQFSPGLVEILLDGYSARDTVVFDPFVGSGTTLFEASRRGLPCYGGDINPAAVFFATQAEFVNLNIQERQQILDIAAQLIEQHLGDYLSPTLFRVPKQTPPTQPIERAIVQLVKEGKGDNNASAKVRLLHSLLVTSLMLAMGDRDSVTGDEFQAAYERNRFIISNLPFNSRICQVFMADARQVPLPNDSINLVITSPPYINVFNYHQNYRKALELLGWRLLEIAPSEIGSNRKHRGNRFMSVVQFCIDLAQVLAEIRRVLCSDGRAIFVIGRESKVRGVAFNNAQLLGAIATGGAGFQLERWQERKFTNRFGVTIYEDILTLKRAVEISDSPAEFGRRVGELALRNALNAVSGEVQEDIEQAIGRSGKILPSPLFRVP